MIVPILCIIGDFGTGKSLLSTYYAKKFSENYPDRNIFANYTLKNIPNFTEYNFGIFKDMKNIPNWLCNGLLIIDEIYLGADAYKFMQSDVNNIWEFIMQIRKKNLELIMCTPRLKFIAVRIRDITNYIIALEEMKIEGVITGHTYYINHVTNETKKIRKFQYNLKNYFSYYDSKQLIRKENNNESE